MGVDRQTSKTGKRLNNRQTNGDIRHEVSVHHVNMQHTCAAAFYSLDLFSETREVSGKNRRGNLDISVEQKSYLFGLGTAGVGRGATGRLFALIPGCVFELTLRFTLLRG